MSDTLSKGLRERLGIPAEAQLDEAGLLAAVDEALTEQAEPTTATLPTGVVAIDRTQLDALQADAAQGRAARQEQLASAREAKITAAITDGRITLASAPQYRALLEQDDKQGSTTGGDLLASLAKNTVPVQAKGFTGGVDEVTDDDQVYAKVWGPTEKKEA